MKVALYLPIKKLKNLKKKVIKIKGVKLAPEFLDLLDILLQAFETLKDKFKDAATSASASTAATAVADVALSSGNPFPGTVSTIPLVSGRSSSPISYITCRIASDIFISIC